MICDGYVCFNFNVINYCMDEVGDGMFYLIDVFVWLLVLFGELLLCVSQIVVVFGDWMDSDGQLWLNGVEDEVYMV